LHQQVSIPKVAKWFRKFRQLTRVQLPALPLPTCRCLPGDRQHGLIILLAPAASLFGRAPPASRLYVPIALFYYRNGPVERRIGLAWGMAPVIIAALGDLIRGLN
jgi:hypothetical protein